MNTRRNHLIWLVTAAAPLLAAWAALADSVRVAWSASPSPALAGYRVYYGTNSGAYSFVTNAGLSRTQAVVLPWRGRWFFAVKAYDTSLLESRFSNEAEWEARPDPPIVDSEPVVRLMPVYERSSNHVDWTTVMGEPTFLAATNDLEFFRTRLTIERVSRVKQ